MHHAPSALLRQPIEGFLLRVEAYVGADGDQAAAEALCAEFLTALLPRARAGVAEVGR